MDQIHSDDLNDGTGVHALEDLVASASSSVNIKGAAAGNKRRVRSQDEENEADDTLKCVALNNEALSFAAQGCDSQAFNLLKRAILISPPDEVSFQSRSISTLFFCYPIPLSPTLFPFFSRSLLFRMLQQRPAFNLAVMLWQCGKRREASELWLSWRFREQFSEGAAVDVCSRLVAEVRIIVNPFNAGKRLTRRNTHRLLYRCHPNGVNSSLHRLPRS